MVQKIANFTKPNPQFHMHESYKITQPLWKNRHENHFLWMHLDEPIVPRLVSCPRKNDDPGDPPRK